MREQGQRLREVSALRNVEVQVMPARRGFHPGKNGPFVVAESKQHWQFGDFESQGVGCVVQDLADVSAFALRYGKLRSQSPDVEESARLIERLAGES
ncbi:Scr1 family TA system antitoxin-like transcriptional regulator [Streptomyces beigongshangae]|uniref:Scr1 family TA system antitoxin-like transcriptional regulator n=1 Tax=Streptomyces beigongshangae TaxID=2841597 RepID=UPI001C8416A0|nr:Scr1 family TA system antitoxin-like transcriptional regulator [Streptomyces sp. REN17]